MRKLEQLKKKLCTDGVQMYSLDELCTSITDGSHFSPPSAENGYYMPSVKDMTETGFDYSKCKIISKIDYESLLKNGCRPQKDDVLIAKDGSMLKYAFVSDGSDNIVILSSIAIFRPKTNIILPSYLACYFRWEKFKKTVIRDYSSKGGVPRIVLKNFKKIRIFVPPIVVQSEIVKVLNNFTKLIVELTAELAARKKQYEYYRRLLLNFSDHEGMKSRGVWRTVKLGDIGKISMCKRIMKSETSPVGDIPFYKIGTFGGEPNAYISKETFEKYKALYSFPKKGDILISAAGTIGRTVIYDGEPAYYQDSNIVWIDNDETIVTNRYLYYVYQLSPWQISIGGTIARLYNDNIANVKINVPPIEEQTRIVNILDHFDKLCNDISEGIPAEIEARRKQYEYYQDKLLSFNQK